MRELIKIGRRSVGLFVKLSFVAAARSNSNSDDNSGNDSSNNSGNNSDNKSSNDNGKTKSLQQAGIGDDGANGSSRFKTRFN